MTLNVKDLVEDLQSAEGTKRSIADRVEHELNKLGLDWEERPTKKGKNYMPTLPHTGVSSLSDTAVSDLQGEFVVMMAYVGEQAILYDVMAEEYEVELKEIMSTIRLKVEGTAAEREDRARTHSKVRKMVRAAKTAKYTSKVLNLKYDVLDKARGVCSRDVERRNKEFSSDRRDASIKGMKRPRGKVRGPIPQSELEVD